MKSLKEALWEFNREVREEDETTCPICLRFKNRLNMLRREIKALEEELATGVRLPKKERR